MNQEPTKKKKRDILCTLLLVGSFLAAMKCIFIGYQMDEGYAIAMSCRILSGDKLITQIWDPHQTSAFFSEFLIRIYTLLFHTTAGVAIWLRIWGTLIHGALSFGIFRVLRRCLYKEYAFYLALLYFNLLPKGYVTPEFSNLLIWFFTLLLLELFHLEQQDGDRKRLFTSLRCGLWMCGMVLSYPSAVIVFPFFAWYLWKREKNGKKYALAFAAVCLAGSALYMGYLLSYMSVDELFYNLHCMMLGNSGHTNVTLLQKFSAYALQCVRSLLISGGYALAAWGLLKLSGRSSENRAESFAGVMYLTLILATVLPLIRWLLTPTNNNYFYIHTVYFTLFLFVFAILRRTEEKSRGLITLWMSGSALVLLAVLLLTDLSILTSIRYLLPGIVMGIAAILIYSGQYAPNVCQKYGKAFVLIWCFAAVFIKGWEYRGDQDLPQNITRVRGIISVGPAKGILAEYMQCAMHESLYSEMQEYIEPGDKVFLLENDATGYLFQDLEIASYTTISDPRYDDTLLKYWELYPDKYPDVMIIPCWYGEIHWNDEEWIIRWVEEEYGATQIIDGTYFRYYIKK